MGGRVDLGGCPESVCSSWNGLCCVVRERKDRDGRLVRLWCSSVGMWAQVRDLLG